MQEKPIRVTILKKKLRFFRAQLADYREALRDLVYHEIASCKRAGLDEYFELLHARATLEKWEGKK